MFSKNMFILGQPFTTPIGTAHPVYIRDREMFNKHIGSLTVDKTQMVSFLKELVKENPSVLPFIGLAESTDFFTFMKAFSDENYRGTFLYDLYSGQRDLFRYIFKEDVLYKIETSEDFEYYRDLIKAMNDVSYEPPNPNPELARLDRLKAKMQEMKGETITFEAMYTSILLAGTVPPNDLTLYQFSKTFDRIGHFKSYDTSTLFKTVDHEGKMDISPWYGMTAVDKPATITQDQLDSAKKLQKDGGLATEL